LQGAKIASKNSIHFALRKQMLVEGEKHCECVIKRFKRVCMSLCVPSRRISGDTKSGYNEAKLCCAENNASPFIPKSQGDYILLVVKITSGARFGWLPLITDENSKPVWEDEIVFSEESYSPRFTNHPDYSVPQDDKNCVGVTSSGVAYWLSCDAKMKLLCIVNE
ncbi:hypothetical protein Avbf_05116, partial [Armadillidium vulgare]